MEITTTKTVEQKSHIPTPSFWKNTEITDRWRAVLDGKTFVDVYRGDNRTCVVSGDPSFHMDNIVEAHTYWDVATEAEFFEAFERVYKSLNLSPVIVTSEELTGGRTHEVRHYQPSKP